MRRDRSSILILAVMFAMATVGVLSMFGRDMRMTFGGKAQSLAGETGVVVPSTTINGTKTLKTFGKQGGNGFSGSPSGYAPSREGYAYAAPNPTVTTTEDRLSTFAIDVDTASYALARRKIQAREWPNPDGVRVEEFLNYFSYDYPAPTHEPYAVHMDAAPSPYEKGKTLLRVGLQARKVPTTERKPTHLTFLVDVSGSMMAEDRLPLAKRALHLLVDNLNETDTVGLVTYAGGVRLVLEQTSAIQKRQIHDAIDSLSAGGGTAMGDGLELAYRVAARTLRPGSQSRVIVLSDGDANVGLTSQEDLQRIIAGRVSEGVTLSVVGFGVGNYQDSRMEALADKGNGNYSYVDTYRQAKRIFQDQLAGTLEVVAKDVKVQVEFSPENVRHYRLIGYENRAIADTDFRKDKVDAGEMGAGHSVTALYELELAPKVVGRLATVRVRAKTPTGQTAEERAFTFDVPSVAPDFQHASADLRFATAVMGFGEILRDSAASRSWSLDQVAAITSDLDVDADRREFVELVSQARQMCQWNSSCRSRSPLAAMP